MNNKIIDLLKEKNYVLPSYLMRNYKEIGLNANLLLFMIYLINLEEPIVCDYNKFSKDVNVNEKDVLLIINELKEKGLLEIELKKNSSSKLEEYLKLELFYNKIFMTLTKQETNKSTNIYSIFEQELGRMLSPIEYELINGWIECNYKEEIILAALKEAVFNGVSNFRYIDKILFEWNKKGIDTLDKIKKNKSEFKKDETNIEVPDYDWLNDNE